MRRSFRWFIFLSLTLSLLLAGVCVTNFVLANGTNGSTGGGNNGSAQPATAPLVSMHTVNMSSVPAATSSNNAFRGDSAPEGVDPVVYARRKAAAAHNLQAPLNAHPAQAVRPASLPAVIHQFQGLADSPANCPIFGHCRHPDMALAASSNWVFQGVNEAWAVYNTSGVLQSGWPKNYQQFFGVPNPPNNCDTLPYMVDVRAFYDPGAGHFWAAMLQDEGAYGYNNCPFQALYWIAVSATNNPNGTWHIYSFDMAQGTTFPVDFTEFGFNGSAVFFSGNLLSLDGNTFEYAEVFAASKSAMQNGSTTVTAKGFKQLKASNTLVDSVQPVETEALGTSAPPSELLVSSFNVNSGGGSCSTGCSGVVAWAFANPLGTQSLTMVVVPTPTYTLPPYADEPGCSLCIETFDTRIGATPIYNDGKISFALETGVNNGTQVVPGIFWGQITPKFTNKKITSATLYQSGIFSFTGDQAASYGAVMDDSQNSLFLAFATMSHTINPGDMYTVNLATDPKGSMETPAFLIQGQAPKTEQYYGDFQATSYDGSSGNHTWFGTEYSNSSGDWSTYIADV
jgi:hypothetical protein